MMEYKETAEMGTLPDTSEDADDIEIDVLEDEEIDVVTSSPSSRAPSPTDHADDITRDYDDVKSPTCSPSPVSSIGSSHSPDYKDAEDDVKCNNGDLKASPPGHVRFSDIPVGCKVTSLEQDLPVLPNGVPTLPKYPRDPGHPNHPSWGTTGSHPFLALSFQRLQEIHMRAIQERLKYSMGGVYAVGSAPQPPVYNPEASHTPNAPRNLPYLGALPEAMYPSTSPGLPRPEVMRPLPNLKWDMEPCRAWTHDLNTPLNLVTKLSPDSMAGSTGSSPGSSAGSPGKAPWTPGTQTSPVQMPWSPESISLDLGAEAPRRRREEPPRYICEACSKSYATFSGLSKHKQFHCASHIKKQFNCKFCEKTYVSLGALKMHIRTHTLPCKCPLCGKAFSRPWLLQGHIRTHTGEKPFRCNQCARAFADRSNLRAHLQTHTDIKKYNCKTCSKTFSRMSLLVKHQEGGCASILR